MDNMTEPITPSEIQLTDIDIVTTVSDNSLIFYEFLFERTGMDPAAPLSITEEVQEEVLHQSLLQLLQDQELPSTRNSSNGYIIYFRS